MREASATPSGLTSADRRRLTPDARPHRRTVRRATAPALLVLLAGLVASGCSDLRSDAAGPNGPPAAVHPDGWSSPAARQNFHGAAIRDDGWDMSGCRSCHGADYAGGISGTSCRRCHTNSPEGCNVCHGSGSGAAPPEDLQGNDETSARGVGAHRAHLDGGTLSAGFECSTCHVVPDSLSAAGHVDGDGRAEVGWSGLAISGGAEPEYDPDAATCAATYCHGGGRFGGGSTMTWTAQEGGAGCASCHALPPAPDTGHPSVADGIPCALCHASVVDAALQIIGPELHVDGRAAVTCGTCHGVPPAPETGHPPLANCSMCHGSVIDAEYRFVDRSLHRNGEVDF